MAVREKEVKIIRPKKAGEQADIIRVGAYCRVSTDSEDQQNSFFAQVRIFSSNSSILLAIDYLPFFLKHRFKNIVSKTLF